MHRLISLFILFVFACQNQSGLEKDPVPPKSPELYMENLIATGMNERDISFSPDGRSLSSGSRDATVRIWGLASGETRTVLRGHTEPVTAVAFSPGGGTVASGSWDRTVRLWDVRVRRPSPRAPEGDRAPAPQ